MDPEKENLSDQEPLLWEDYDAESERQAGVETFYKINHINQTYDFVKRMREEYGKLDKVEMSIWECCELLNDVIDESDPDLDEPQIEHLLQTAEAIRQDYPNEDWLHLTALIHDLGKVLHHPKFGELPQWAVVVFQGKSRPQPAYNSKFGVYKEGCGLDNVLMSWGHDDYMYLVAKENKSTLPSAGLFVIRYHSFYALHRAGAYKYLMNKEDEENMKWLKIFNKYDLYSKSKVRVDVEKVKPYYLSLIHKHEDSRGDILDHRFRVFSCTAAMQCCSTDFPRLTASRPLCKH
ncbi:UNVERIFIED_CONTAM: Inositol oxygenase 1 [Sesamum angustifolium]|uniref:Inositol oxygenase n=1 Tax=Sesamum angustifolium TaxID=2727405 RepID=A0AAW2LNN2_9LAMI